MKLLEYEAKGLLKSVMGPVVMGLVTDSAQEAVAYCRQLPLPVVLKAQVEAGGRGKAGGVKFCATMEEVEAAANAILGMEIKGLVVQEILVSKAVDIAEEWYAGIVFNRAARAYTAIFSTEGGVDIEEVAASRPEAIARLDILPHVGLEVFDADALARRAGLKGGLADEVGGVFMDMWGILVETDLDLVEINPLVLAKDGGVVALDCKMTVDEAALWRQPEVVALRATQPLGEEALAKEMGFSFVGLDGDIGVIGNGAGLVMGTMDAVKAAGGSPANFLDIGGGARAEVVEKALRMVEARPGITGILVNVFGGITRGDEVARGL
ncbi:ADP-forming succinate--CoA ligase subunit beta, partial [bacterium]|nr:ADP-forming succinate--CoA ligase subunit beta [bacterium]